MAKRRSVKQEHAGSATVGRQVIGRRSAKPAPSAAENPRRPEDPPTLTSFAWQRLEGFAVGLLAALLIYAIYYPADSVGVELGQAVYLCGGALLFGWAAWIARPAVASWRADRWSLCFDVSLWALAAWMAAACWANAAQANLRMAVNELWVWIAAAAVVTGARRVLRVSAARQAFVFLLIAIGCGLAVHGWHQLEVSLPVDRARYEANPERVLNEAGIDPADAPPGSAERMNFENRLLDGGPTATFALANSLAALLLIAWVIAWGLFLRHGLRTGGKQWSVADRVFLGIAGAAVLLIGVMLLRSHSRSAVGSAFLAGCGLLVYEFANRAPGGTSGLATMLRRPTASKGKLAAASIAAVLLVGGGVVWVSSRRELLDRALPSLLFRFQYWRSTLSLVWENPWFGCGPGNFQACYERYRELSASEQIAEPHNWFMETLAVGGLPAGLLLLLSIFSLAKLAIHRQGGPAETSSAEQPTARSADTGAVRRGDDHRARKRSRVVWIGVGLGLLAVWGVGGLIGWLPDVEAHLLAVPLAALVLAGLWRCRANGLTARASVSAALLAVMLHLSVSGGWTVPGIALPIWILAASVAPVPVGQRRDDAMLTGEGETGGAAAGVSRPHSPLLVARLGILAVGAFLLVWLQRSAVTPMQQVTVAQAHLADALASGRVDEAITALQRAADSDRWNPRPLMDLAALQQSKLLQLEGDRLPTSGPSRTYVATTLVQLDQAEQEALQRAPGDPALWRFLARQRLHLFQRWGRREDLEVAARRLRQAFQLAPAQESVAAQLAVVEQQRGDIQEAQRWARRAQSLARAGGHVGRQLDRVVVLVPRKVGAAVQERPQQAFAADALANFLGS